MILKTGIGSVTSVFIHENVNRCLERLTRQHEGYHLILQLMEYEWHLSDAIYNDSKNISFNWHILNQRRANLKMTSHFHNRPIDCRTKYTVSDIPLGHNRTQSPIF